jgi:2-keto-4-pentenoate hydratase
MPTPPPPADLGEAMRVLLARRSAALEGGAQAVGWKIGINVPALQELFGLSGPVVGYLTDATVMAAGSPVEIASWDHPALEVEVAIRVGADGGVAALAPALELVDLNLPFDRIEPILAGNVFHRGVIFGPEIGVEEAGGLVAGLNDLVEDLTVEVSGGGSSLATGRLSEAPSVTVSVVRSFLESHGASLEPGQRIIAGSLIAPMAISPDDDLSVSFGRLGSLDVSFC